MSGEMQIPLLQLVASISNTTDLMSPLLADHHKRVAYIAFSIARQLGLPYKECKAILMAGALHDLGALSLTERINALSFEARDPHRHAESGYRLLKLLPPFADIASMIRYHHVAWNHGAGSEHAGLPVSEHSHICLLYTSPSPRD